MPKVTISSSTVETPENSKFSTLSSGDKSVVTSAIDAYLGKRNLREGESLDEVVNNLRQQFSTPAKLLELKGASLTGAQRYEGRPSSSVNAR